MYFFYQIGLMFLLYSGVVVKRKDTVQKVHNRGFERMSSNGLRINLKK